MDIYNNSIALKLVTHPIKKIDEVVSDNKNP